VTPVAVTQRVELTPHGERRDCLDQRWTRWLGACGLLPVLLPNHAEAAAAVSRQSRVTGLLLTGGNDLAAMGGDAPERDDMETRMLALACERGWPVIGVCRGMQIVQSFFGLTLQPVEGHVAPVAPIRLADGSLREVNSYHRFGTAATLPALEVWARAEDGTVKAVRHVSQPILGIMWHPERLEPFPREDINLFVRHFGSVVECGQ